MFTWEQVIGQLARYDGDGQRMLSTYLATDPVTGAGVDLSAQLKDLARPLLQRRTSLSESEQLAGEIELVTTAVRQLEPPPRAVAVFSCAAGGFLRALPLRLPIRPRIHWGRAFNLRPLIALVDEHERMLVLLLDERRARVFRTLLGEIEEIEDLCDYVPDRHHQGGYGQSGSQRDHDTHVLAHVRHVSGTLKRLLSREKVDRILVGGPPEVVVLLERALPTLLRHRVHAGLNVPLVAAPEEVLASAMALGQQLERKSEDRLVQDLLERRGSGTSAFGPTATIDAVNGRRVHTLIVSDALRLAGYECDACGRTGDGSRPPSCPVCGGRVLPIADLVAALEDRVLAQNGCIEEVRGPAAAVLDANGGLAARLRYAPESVYPTVPPA